jgi:UDP-GlcNAc:undecaprenyl-phosphate GlcNAc-1-phosphate transferase
MGGLLAPVVLCPAIALAISWLLTGLLIRWAPRLGLVDHPDPRKVHTRPTPRAGGIAIVAGFLLAGGAWVAWEGAGSDAPLPWLMALGFLVFLLGLLDDLRPLPWQLRLAVQAVVAAGAVAWVLPPADLWLRAAAWFWVVALVNAFNMLDNMDALSGGTAAIAAVYLALLGWLSGDGAGEWVAYSVLAAAVAGFLWWNRPPARIFMGDCGSTFLGFVLGVGTARFGLGPGRPAWSWAVPLCVAAVPCYDLVTVVTIRLSQGRSPFHPDKQHLSHRLVSRGLASPVAVRLIHLMALASGASAVILLFVPSGTAAGLVVGQLAAWWLVLAGTEFLARREGKP